MEDTVIGGYEIGSVIGIGTYGEVRHGKHVVSGKHVALKIVDLNRFEDDTAELMLKEIKILELVNHKHCIQILDMKEDQPCSGRWCDNCACSNFEELTGGVCGSCGHHGHSHTQHEERRCMFIVQELAAGGEFFGLLMHCGAFTEDIAAYYFKQLISGLEYLHSRGVIHRDLKPENLCLDSEFNLKIVDFGLAALNEQQPEAVLHSGVGSQPYSAPEVYYTKELYEGVGYEGAPADIWSCAVILFVMLTGRPPFLRPLTKTYGPTLKRCKHFTNLMKGNGYDGMSLAAKDLLQKLFVVNPQDRLSIAEIKNHVWLTTPTPPAEAIMKIMDEKATEVWRAQDKDIMIDVLASMRKTDLLMDVDDVDMQMSPTSSTPNDSDSDVDMYDKGMDIQNNSYHYPNSPAMLSNMSMPSASPNFTFTMPQPSPPASNSINEGFDPFKNANTSVSLLHMEEDEPVYRGIRLPATTEVKDEATTSTVSIEPAVVSPIAAKSQEVSIFQRFVTSMGVTETTELVMQYLVAQNMKHKVDVHKDTDQHTATVQVVGHFQRSLLVFRVLIAPVEKGQTSSVSFKRVRGSIMPLYTLFRDCAKDLSTCTPASTASCI